MNERKDMKVKVTLWIEGDKISFQIDDVNLNKLKSIIGCNSSQLVDIVHLLPSQEKTRHLFIKPCKVVFMAIDNMPLVAVPDTKIPQGIKLAK